MGFRRDGKSEYSDQNAFDEWKRLNGDLLTKCGLPIGVLRSRGDWDYLLEHGYWCEDYYGKHVGNIDFDLDEQTPEQRSAFRKLLERTLNEEERERGCAAWHHVHPPGFD